MYAEIIQDRFRRHYRLHGLDDQPLPVTIKPENFRDFVLTEQFVRDLRVPEGYWQRIVSRYDQWNSQPNSTAERRISQLLINGRIKLYPLEHANRGFAIGATHDYPAVTTNTGLIYQLVPASVLLTNFTSKIKSFTSKQEVEQFLVRLAPDDTQLNNLLQASGLKGMKAEKSGTTKIAVIAQAMQDGKLVVIEKQQGVISTKETKAEELPAQGPGNKPATLGPHESGVRGYEQSNDANVSDKHNFLYVASGGKRGETPLTLEQRAEVDEYLDNFELDDVSVRYVDDTNLNTGYAHGKLFSILNIGSDVVPGNTGAGTLTANSRISIRGTLAHEIVGHREAALANRTQDIPALEEAQASIRAARFAPGLTGTERVALLRDGISRLKSKGIKIRDVKSILFINQR